MEERHPRGFAFHGAGAKPTFTALQLRRSYLPGSSHRSLRPTPAAFVGRKNSKCQTGFFSSLIKRNRESVSIHSWSLLSRKATGAGMAAETPAGRADRLKQAARSGGWFSVRPAGKRSRQPAVPDAAFLKGILTRY